MYKRMIVPLDGSKVAEQVLPYVSYLAQRLGSHVELLHVVEPLRGYLVSPAHDRYLEQIMARMKSRGVEYLRQGVEELEKYGLSVSSRLEVGDPASCILDESKGDQDSMIAMSTHGRSGIGRWVLGSVSGRVLQHGRSPVLLVRSRLGQAEGPHEAKISSLVVPLDGSELAEAVIPHAARIATALSLKVSLIRVTPWIPDEYLYPDYPIVVPESVTKEVDEAAQVYLQGVAENLSQQGISLVDRFLLHGPPADGIINFAHQAPNSLIAMTTHGRSGAGRWALGSVADRVIQHAGHPVLIVRAADKRKKK